MAIKTKSISVFVSLKVLLAGLCYRPVAGSRPNAQNLLENIIYNFGFKIQPLDQIYFASRKKIS